MRKVVVGLGNPEPRYAWTRHNAGWLVIDRLFALSGQQPAFDPAARAERGIAQTGGIEIALLKPHTGMNSSGKSVAAVLSELSLPASAVLVVYDDVTLPMGRLKFQYAGGSGGHRGIDSVVSELGTVDFARLKLGVGPGPSGPARLDFVLSPMEEADRPSYLRLVELAGDAVNAWALEGLQSAMCRFNSAKPRPAAG